MKKLNRMKKKKWSWRGFSFFFLLHIFILRLRSLFLFLFSITIDHHHSRSQWHHQSILSRIIFSVNWNHIAMLYKELSNNGLVSFSIACSINKKNSWLNDFNVRLDLWILTREAKCRSCHLLYDIQDGAKVTHPQENWISALRLEQTNWIFRRW